MHSWTLDKLQVLELHLKLNRHVAGGGTYLDAFAGDGHLTVKRTLRDGSALIAARAGVFRHLYLVELDEQRNARLGRHRAPTASRPNRFDQVLDRILGSRAAWQDLLDDDKSLAALAREMTFPRPDVDEAAAAVVAVIAVVDAAAPVTRQRHHTRSVRWLRRCPPAIRSKWTGQIWAERTAFSGWGSASPLPALCHDQ